MKVKVEIKYPEDKLQDSKGRGKKHNKLFVVLEEQ